MKLIVENASFSYKEEVPVIRHLNFTVSSGELTAVLGPNGAGKTTLLRCMMGFLSWKEGRCLIDGEDIRTMPARKLWQRVSYVPQARGAFASMTARDMILLGCTNRIGLFSVPGNAEKKQVEDLADQLGIFGLLGKKCTEISGGELQMVLIARALAARPELLILDEPESNLDFKNQLIVLDTMSRLAAEGMCCIFNTHYPTHALMRASKSLILHKGGEAVFGDTATVLTEKEIEKAFGVKAVIGEIETTGNVYQSILPLKIIEKEKDSGKPAEEKGISETKMSGADGQRAEDAQENKEDGPGYNKEKSARDYPDEHTIAVISLIFKDYSLSEKINGLFHEYNSYIVGRMGVPYREGGVCIVNVTLDAPRESIAALSHRLNVLPGVNVKTTYAE